MPPRITAMPNRRTPSYRPLQGFDDTLVEAFLPLYKKEAAKHTADFRKYGANMGRRTVKSVQAAVPVLFAKVTAPPADKPFGPAWLPQVTAPIVDPLMAGFKQEITPFVQQMKTRAILVASVAVGGTLLLGFLLGRLSKGTPK